MEAFLCTQCPLAFEIGDLDHGAFSGSADQLICTACGVMHRLIFHEAQGCHDMQTGTSELFALTNPIRELTTSMHDNGFGVQLENYVWPYTEKDWIKVAEFENRPALGILDCHQCEIPGRLVSRERPKNEFGRWPIFRDKDGELYCPICKGAIESLYVSF